jgi:hypothetical protein
MVPVIGNVATLFVIDAGASKTWSAVNTSGEQTLTVPGVKSTDEMVGVSKPSFQSGLAVAGARVSADNTVSITFFAAGTVTPTANEVYTIVIARTENTLTDASA